jgi:paraquat-inducible protein B
MMSTQASKTLIGAFVVGAVALIVVAVIIIGGGRFFEKSIKLVAYFDGSVKGLGVGSKVQLKGVTIGQVSDVRLLFHPKTLKFINRVLIIIESGTIAGYQEDAGDEKALKEFQSDPAVLIDMLVNRGLRAKLAMESIVTGKLLVAMDFYPDTKVHLRGIEPEYIEIPTVPTDFEKLTKTLEELPLEDLVYEVRDAVAGIRKLVTSEELNQSLQALNQTLQRTEQLVAHIDDKVDPLAQRLDATLGHYGTLAQTIDRQVTPMARSITMTAAEAQQLLQTVDASLGEALQQASATLETVQSFAGQDSQFQRELGDTLNELSGAARAIRRLADYLETHPETLLRGKSRPGGN